MKNYKIIIAALAGALFFIGCNNAGKIETSAARTPSETIKAINEAGKKKDPAAVKRMLSKGTLVLFENAAKSQNTTSDELLKKEGGTPFTPLPEIRGEKIEGDKATVTVKNEFTGGDENIPFVKEDGEWKAALDLYLEDLKKRYDEDMNKPPSNIVEVPKESNSATNKK